MVILLGTKTTISAALGHDFMVERGFSVTGIGRVVVAEGKTHAAVENRL